jgi:Uncharacterized conserved protein
MIIILVSVLGCNNYEYEKVKSAIAQSFANLGGISKYINKNETVLLKVNLIMKKNPDEAATTHPAIVRALAEILINYGCNVVIGDSPGGPFRESLLRSIYKTTGMEEVAAQTGAALNYNTGTTHVDNTNGHILKHLTVADFITKVDKIISVSKLKAHCMTKMTGATKNMFGTIPGTVKAEYHFNCPDPTTFADCLIDICLNASPILSFMDAIVAMEGHGPTSGEPRQIGAIIASPSPYELDLAASKIINVKPDQVPMLARMIQRGLCSTSPEHIKYVGDDINNFVKTDFVIPKTGSMHFLGDNPPKFLEDFVKHNLHPKPIFRHDLCIGCGDCALNCPAKIITMKDHKPYVDIDKCIRCFCCQELCPKKAVDIHRPLLLKILSKF